jgi:hypothetical protein
MPRFPPPTYQSTNTLTRPPQGVQNYEDFTRWPNLAYQRDANPDDAAHFERLFGRLPTQDELDDWVRSLYRLLTMGY